MTQILIKRAKNKLFHSGYLYVFEKVNKDEDIKFWRCESFNKVDIKCKARLHTNLNNDVLKELNFHICDTNAATPMQYYDWN